VPAGRNAVVTLEPDVARAFRTSEAVNEALRLVLRLARFASPRPAFDRDRPGRPGPFPPRGAGPHGAARSALRRAVNAVPRHGRSSTTTSDPQIGYLTRFGGDYR
jgi:hypothetical protein